MIYAKKSLGQNFLINKGVLDKVVNAAELDKNDTVLEIGPGKGVLTEKLAEKAGRVIAIEKDHRLIESLTEMFSTESAVAKNVEIVEGDILKFDISRFKFKNSDYKIVANIPYYITSNLLRTIFEKWPTPKLIVVMVQKEVAQRIMAKPPHMNLLALSIQFYAEPKIISYVSKGSFRPQPKVDSAIVKLIPKPRILKPEQLEKLFKIIKSAFAGKRKQLINTLSRNSGMIISKEDALKILSRLGLRSDIRAENLTLEQWVDLANYIKG